MEYKKQFLSNLLTAVFLMVLCAPSPVPAQTSFGRISGTVSAQDGSVIAGAQVTVKNTDTQLTRQTATDQQGFYVFTELPIGTYSLEINQSGFNKSARSGVVLVADGRVTVDFSLVVGSPSQTVEVQGTNMEALNTTSGELSHVIDTRQVTNLPLNGRNYIQLMTLVPGAVVTNPDQFSVTTSLAANNQNLNGNRADSNNLTIDGGYNMPAGSNTSLMNNISAEFIQEVKLQTSNSSAEYGRMSGPTFNIVTKNGTNQFHGSAFEFLRNDAMDATNYFAKKKTALHFNDFGYTLGGPILHNKLFFFVGEEWKRLRQNQTTQQQTIPDTAFMNGDFSALLPATQLYYPGTKTPIPGNNVSAMMTPDGKAIANVYRLMAKTGAGFLDANVANNLTLNPLNPLDYREDIVRVDYVFSEKNFAYGRWLQDYNSLIDPFGTFSSSNLPTTPTVRNRPGESILFAETWIPTPNFVNEARANASWVSQHIVPTGTAWQRSTYGFQYPLLFGGARYPNGIPYVTMTGYASFQGPNFALNSPTTDIQFADTISWTHRSHVLRAGAVLIRDRVDQNGRSLYTGSINFNPSNNTNTTGFSFADALLGNFSSYSEASADPTGFFRFWQPEAFVQDTWRVSPKLSLDLGVRWQYMQAIYTQANNMANFDPARFDPNQAVQITQDSKGLIVPNSGNPYNGLVRAGSGIPKDQAFRVPGADGPLYAAIPAGAPRGLYPGSNNIGPRLGFAYSVDDKTTLRGGFGLFYNRAEGNIDFSQVNIPPFLQIATYTNGNLSNITGGSTSQAPLGGITAIDPNLKTQTIAQYSLNLQHEMPFGLLVELSYVGTEGRHMLRQPNINYPELTLTAANPKISTNAFVPYKGFTSITQIRSDATANYNALQAYVSKRAGALQMTAGYTWSKSLADASNEGDNSENWTVRHYNYGPTSFDRREAFFSTFVWQMPRLEGHHSVVRGIAGGWQLSGVARLQSGQYYTITGSTQTGTRRADLVGHPSSVQHKSIQQWFDTSIYKVAPANRFGNAGTGTVVGPGLALLDASLGKNFPIAERFNLKFQGDFFNALNRTNFSTLNTNRSNSNFGTISSANPPRQVQLSLKLSF
jgi:hypothetical protein